jgi:hypothetical protein
MFGALIIWIFFPILAFDIDDGTIANAFNLYTGPISIVLAMSAGALGAFSFSSFFNERMIARDIIHGPIAGAIACGTASFYITNPVYAILVGFAAGIIQTFIQNVI